jgi:hypothetical protein
MPEGRLQRTRAAYLDAAYIADALRGHGGPTPDRLAKAQALARRARVPWADVEELLRDTYGHPDRHD